MIKNFLYIIFLITFYNLSRHPVIEPEFKPFYDDFLITLGETSTNIRIGFKPLPRTKKGDVIGVCNPFLRNIYIDPIFWNEASDLERRTTIYHELGHCLLWRGHDERKRKDKCEYSIMHPSIPPRKCLQKHWNSYIMELFSF